MSLHVTPLHTFANCPCCSSRFNDSLRSGFQSSVHDQYQSNAQAYDKSLLQKLDARRGSDNLTPPRSYSKPHFSSSASDISPTTRTPLEARYSNSLKTPLSLPILPGKPPSESHVSRWPDSISSNTSPTHPYPRFGVHSQLEFRSPNSAAESNKSYVPYARRHDSASAMDVCDDTSSVTSRSRDSYDQRASPDQDVDFHMDERLHIEDYSFRSDAYSPGSITGQKRRASSPPGEEGPSLHVVGSTSDLFRRRESGSRASPGPRFHSASGSMSSTASAPRCNSASTVMSFGASSVTSMNSYGLSPNGLSPVPTDGSDSPYVTSLSLNPSPRGSISRTNPSRALQETRPIISSRKMSDGTGSSKHNTLKMQGVYICECCPKKPKKFDSPEELKYFSPYSELLLPGSH